MSEEPEPPEGAVVLGFAGGLVLVLVGATLQSLLEGVVGAALLLFAFNAWSKRGAGATDGLARTLDDARVLTQGDELSVDGLHRGERVWLARSSVIPGTLCRVVLEAPGAVRGTIKAGEGGAPPRFVGGPTATLPPALSSGPVGQALTTLLERCPFVRIRAAEVEVLVEEPGAIPAVLEALTSLVRALRAQPQAVKVDLRSRGQLGADCPYCREALGGREPMACAQCGMQHHVECFLEHGRCTVLACGGRVPPARERGA